MKKNLWCNKCKKFPSRIVEKYSKKLKEERIWDGICYALDKSNIDDLEFVSYCYKCDTKLIYK